MTGDTSCSCWYFSAVSVWWGILWVSCLLTSSLFTCPCHSYYPLLIIQKINKLSSNLKCISKVLVFFEVFVDWEKSDQYPIISVLEEGWSWPTAGLCWPSSLLLSGLTLDKPNRILICPSSRDMSIRWPGESQSRSGVHVWGGGKAIATLPGVLENIIIAVLRKLKKVTSYLVTLLTMISGAGKILYDIKTITDIDILKLIVLLASMKSIRSEDWQTVTFLSGRTPGADIYNWRCININIICWWQSLVSF